MSGTVLAGLPASSFLLDGCSQDLLVADGLLLSDRSGFDVVTEFGDVRRLVDP